MTNRNYRYYDFIVAAFVTVLLCSNLIGAGKAAEVDLPYFGHVVFGKLLLQGLDKEVEIHRNRVAWGIYLFVMWVGHFFFTEFGQVLGPLPSAN